MTSIWVLSRSIRPRSIAGLISQFGLVDKKGMNGKGEEPYRDKCFNLGTQDAQQKAQAEELKNALKQIQNVRIRYVGVWDTVPSLGVPDLYVFGADIHPNKLLDNPNKKYEFHDTDLHLNIVLVWMIQQVVEHTGLEFSPEQMGEFLVWNPQQSQKKEPGMCRLCRHRFRDLEIKGSRKTRKGERCTYVCSSVYLGKEEIPMKNPVNRGIHTFQLKNWDAWKSS